MTQLTVNDLARKAGVSPHTVRYYDRVGLLPQPPRSPSGYRLYPPEGVERLRFIRGAKHLGLRLQDIAQLLEVMDRGQCPCGHSESVLRGRLTEIDEEIARLAKLRDELERLLDTTRPSPAPAPTRTHGGAGKTSQEGGEPIGTLPRVRLPVRSEALPLLRQ